MRHGKIFIVLAFACTRTPKRHAPAERNHFSDRPEPIEQGTDATGRSIQAKSDTGVGILRNLAGPNCSNVVDQSLDADAWYDAAAQACHPGSKRRSAVLLQAAIRNGSVDIDIPTGPNSSCWTAFAIVDRVLLPMLVDIVDKDGNARSMGKLWSTQSAIPSFGPFCALEENFRTLRLRAETTAAGKVSWALYSSE
jgi:hypothetical protein